MLFVPWWIAIGNRAISHSAEKLTDTVPAFARTIATTDNQEIAVLIVDVLGLDFEPCLISRTWLVHGSWIFDDQSLLSIFLISLAAYVLASTTFWRWLGPMLPRYHHGLTFHRGAGGSNDRAFR